MTTSKDQNTFPAETTSPTPSAVVGRDELNLIELPFTLIANDNKQGLQKFERRWVEQGREFFLSITPNTAFGLPTFRAEEVFIAALELTHHQGFKNPQVHTTKQELLGLMQWPDTGHYRRLLQLSFDQLQATAIRTDRFWDHRTRQYLAPNYTGFSIIANFRFYTDQPRRRGQMDLPLSWFRWDQIVWESFSAGYIKRLDTGLYFSLQSNLARRLYRYVDKWLYQGGQEIDLDKLATVKLGMSEQYRYPSDIATKLKPAIAELNERGVARIRIDQSKSTESGYKVVIQPPTARQGGGGSPKGSTEQESGGKHLGSTILTPGSPSTPSPGLAEQLIGRGITPAAARMLLQKHDAARVTRHLEVFDFLVHKPGNDIKNPPAYLRRMIEEEWFLDRCPDGFRSRQEQEEERAQKAQAKNDLLAEYQQAAARIQREVGAWAALPPEKRIDFGHLDAWVTSQRLLRHRTPSEQEQAERLARMVGELRTPEQELARRLAILQHEITQQATQQGIGPMDFPGEHAGSG